MGQRLFSYKPYVLITIMTVIFVSAICEAADLAVLQCTNRIELTVKNTTAYNRREDVGRIGSATVGSDIYYFRVWAEFDISQLADKRVSDVGFRVYNSYSGNLISGMRYAQIRPRDADMYLLLAQHNNSDNFYGNINWSINPGDAWTPSSESDFHYPDPNLYKRPNGNTLADDLQAHIDSADSNNTWFAVEFYSNSNPQAWLHFGSDSGNPASIQMAVTYTEIDEGKNAGTPDGDPRTCPDVNVPINFTTGNAYQVETDFILSGPGLPMGYQRYYNSRREALTALGHGWRGDYSRYLTENSDTLIILHEPDGKEVHFIFDQDEGKFISEAGPIRKIEKVGDTYELIEPDGTIQSFNNAGQITRIEDRNGNYQEIGYEGLKLSFVEDNFGKRIDFHYDGTGLRFDHISTPIGDLHFIYENDNLKSVTYPDSTSRTYLYDDIDPHNLTVIMNEEGKRSLTVRYDTEDRAISEELNGGLLKTSVEYKAGLERVITDSLQRQTTFGLQADKGIGRVKSAVGTGCKTCLTPADTSYNLTDRLQTENATDGRGITEKYTYDSRGNTEFYTQALDTDDVRTFGYTWHPDYSLPDVFTRKSVVNETLNTTADFDYDTTGNPDFLVENGYDSDGPITRTTDFAYDGPGGQLTFVEGPRTDVTDSLTLEYYPNDETEGLNRGQLHKTINAKGHVTEYKDYNKFGLPETVIDVNNVTATLEYDARGRLRYQTEDHKITEYQYYDTGLLKKIIPPGNKGVLTYEYTDAGLLEIIRDQTGDYIKYGYNDTQGNKTDIWHYEADGTMRRHIEQRYDDDNRLQKIINPDQTFEEFGYDDNGNITGYTDAVNNHTDYKYDHLNRIETRTQPGNIVTDYSFDGHDNPDTVTDGENNVTDYDYDDFGRLRKVTSPDTGITTYTYDEADNMKTKTDANLVTVNYTYDELNRLTDVEFPDSSQNIGFTYDETSAVYGKGRLTTANDPAGSNAYKYDALGRTVQVTRVTDSQPYSTNYDYNDRGNIETLTYPTGTQAVYLRYDNELVSGVLVDGVILTKNVTYLPFGPEADFTFGNDILTVDRTFYDNYFRVERIDAGVLNYHYTYYDDGKVHTIDGIPLPSSSGTQTGYEYPNGNLLDHTTGYKATDYVYDNNGNITSDGTYTFVYNQNNRLSEVKIGTDVIARYAYDAFGRRIKKEIISSGEIIHYHYDLQSNLLAESMTDGTPLRDYIYQNGNLVAIKIYGDEAGIYYVIGDHLGTPQQIVNTSGQVVWKAAYLPFGQAQILVETIKCNIRFKGQYFDAETGLHYNINRYYDPDTGRYLTPDPIGLDGGINLWAYVLNNPVNLIDFFGLAPGDNFKTMDATAIDAIDHVRGKTIRNNVEYGGFIYKADDNHYSYTEAVPGTERSLNKSEFNKPPNGKWAEAIYHTHTGRKYNAFWFSTDDYIASGGAPIYLGTIDGRIKVWSADGGERLVRGKCL